jgi:predicted Zn-dependent protease
MPLLLTSCATAFNPATGKREAVFLNAAAETKIGAGINNNIVSKLKLTSDAKYLARMKDITGKVLAGVDKRGIGYKVGVVADNGPNAFTIPGGYVYATTGLMDNVSDAELAAAIAHEVGHSEARHAVKQLEASIGYTTLMDVGYLLDPRKPDEKKDWQYIRSGSDAVFSLVNLGYSRRDEYEADRLGVRYLLAAGYDPAGMISLMQKLKAGENKNDPKWLYFLRSHPYLDERILVVKEEIAKSKTPPQALTLKAGAKD